MFELDAQVFGLPICADHLQMGCVLFEKSVTIILNKIVSARGGLQFLADGPEEGNQCVALLANGRLQCGDYVRPEMLQLLCAVFRFKRLDCLRQVVNLRHGIIQVLCPGRASPEPSTAARLQNGSDPVVIGASERPCHVAEKFAASEFSGEAGTVHHHEVGSQFGFASASLRQAAAMNRLGHVFFAGTGLPDNQDWVIMMGSLLNLAEMAELSVAFAIVLIQRLDSRMETGPLPLDHDFVFAKLNNVLDRVQQTAERMQ